MALSDLNDYKFNQRTFRIVGYAQIILMMLSASFTLATFIHTIDGSWEVRYLPGVFSLIALERFLMHRRLKELTFNTTDWWIVLGSQWVVIFLFIKAVLLFSAGGDAALVEMQSLAKNFLEGFFDVRYIIVLFLSVTVWMECGLLADLLDEIGLETSRPIHESAIFEPAAPPSPRQRLTSHIITHGIILVMLTGLMRIDLRNALTRAVQIQPTQISFLEAGGWSTLLYFIFGMSLFSQVHLIHLIARWRAMRVPINRSLVRNWTYFALVFLLLLAGVAILLPTSFSMGFLELLAYIIHYLFIGLAIIVQLVWLVLVILFSLPLMLLNIAPANIPKPAMPSGEEGLPPAIENIPPTPLIELIKAFVFWGVFFFVIVFAIVQYARQHEDVYHFLRGFAPVRWLIKAWYRLTELFRKAGHRLSGVVINTINRLSFTGNGRKPRLVDRFMSLRRLTPRQRVVFYFLALLRRGNERGLPRAGSQTPYEYAASLENALPEVDQEIATMSESYVEARYSQHPITVDMVSMVKERWQRIRQALLGRHKGN